MGFTITSVHQLQESRCNWQTILNRVEKQKGIVYSNASFNKNEEMEVEVRPWRNSRAICGGCSKKVSICDHTSIRRFQYVPLCDSPGLADTGEWLPLSSKHEATVQAGDVP